MDEFTKLQELESKDSVINFRINSKAKSFIKEYCKKIEKKTLTDFITNSIFFCIGLTKRIQVLETELKQLKEENDMKEIELEIPGKLYEKLMKISLFKNKTVKEIILEDLEGLVDSEEDQLQSLGYTLNGEITVG